MARRGLTVLFTLLGAAVFVSIAAFFALYLLFRAGAVDHDELHACAARRGAICPKWRRPT